MIGAVVRKGERTGKVEGIGKPFLDGALAVYVIGIDNTFADWWRLDEVTFISEEVPVSQHALTA
jgi:hypothetical protein